MGRSTITDLTEELTAAAADVSAACFDRPWSADDLRAERRRAASLCRVACVEGRVVAYAVLRVVSDEGELLTLGVRPEARGRGVGTALLDGLLRDAAARGVTRVHLEVRADDAIARALYHRLGFEDVGARRGYYADGADAALMTWEARGRTPPPARG